MPLVSSITEEKNNRNSDYAIYESYDNQYIYGCNSVSYYTDTKSKITVLHTFDTKLKILITAKKIGFTYG